MLRTRTSCSTATRTPNIDVGVRRLLRGPDPGLGTERAEPVRGHDQELGVRPGRRRRRHPDRRRRRPGPQQRVHRHPSDQRGPHRLAAALRRRATPYPAATTSTTSTSRSWRPTAAATSRSPTTCSSAPAATARRSSSAVTTQPVFAHNVTKNIDVYMDAKTGEPSGTNNVARDNVVVERRDQRAGARSAPTARTRHNLFSRAADSRRAPNATVGTPVFVGGGQPDGVGGLCRSPPARPARARRATASTAASARRHATPPTRRRRPRPTPDARRPARRPRTTPADSGLDRSRRARPPARR